MINDKKSLLLYNSLEFFTLPTSRTANWRSEFVFKLTKSVSSFINCKTKCRPEHRIVENFQIKISNFTHLHALGSYVLIVQNAEIIEQSVKFEKKNISRVKVALQFKHVSLLLHSFWVVPGMYQQKYIDLFCFNYVHFFTLNYEKNDVTSDETSLSHRCLN